MSSTNKFDYSYSDDHLTVNGKVLTLSHRVEKCLMAPTGLVVLLDRNAGNRRNVLLIGVDGCILWQIDEIGEPDGDRPHSYSGIYLTEEGQLEVLSPLGYLCDVDLATGRLVYCHFTSC